MTEADDDKRTEYEQSRDLTRRLCDELAGESDDALDHDKVRELVDAARNLTDDADQLVVELADQAANAAAASSSSSSSAAGDPAPGTTGEAPAPVAMPVEHPDGVAGDPLTPGAPSPDAQATGEEADQPAAAGESTGTTAGAPETDGAPQ